MKILIMMFATLFCLLARAENPPLEPPYTSATEPTSTSFKPVPQPTSIDDDGDYHYEPVTKDEAVYYKVPPPPPIKSSIFVRMGSMGPFDIKADNGKTYKQVYGNKSSLLVGFDYERQLGSFLGKWSWKLGSGITTGEGQGSFANPSNTAVPEEKFLLFIFPNTASLNYKLRFSDTQLFIPYAEFGAGYFTFLEYRNDGNKKTFGGAPIASVAGGLLFSLSALNKVHAAEMYEDYGVKHLWLDLQFRRILGLSTRKDFSSNMLSAGFGFAF
jgi:hypothetical protein